MPDPDLRRALEYIIPYWRRLLLVLLLSLIGTALSLYLPYLSKELVDSALVGRDATALIRIVSLFALITLLSFAINVLSGSSTPVDATRLTIKAPHAFKGIMTQTGADVASIK